MIKACFHVIGIGDGGEQNAALGRAAVIGG